VLASAASWSAPKLASSGIAFHLPVQSSSRKDAACSSSQRLLQRKLFNRIENFSNRAHAGKLSAMRFGVNAAKLDLSQRRSRRWVTHLF